MFTKRQIVFSLLAYFFTFIVGIIFSILFHFDPVNNPEQAANPPLVFCLATIVGSIVISAGIAYLYFTHRKPKLKASVNSGLKLGITMVVVGFILDLIMFLPMVLSLGGPGLLIEYYQKWYFIVALLGVVAGATGMGYWLEQKKSR